MGVLSRTWALMGASWRVLMLDKELLLFPLLSLIAIGLVIVTIVGPLSETQLCPSKNQVGPVTDEVLCLGILFLVYVCSYSIAIFFNASLIAAVRLRLTGQDPTLMDGLREAWARKNALLAWALLAATVGLFLHAMQKRSKGWTSLLFGMTEVAWHMATYFVIPILVIEGKGPVEAVKESAATLRRTWGEQLTGNVNYTLMMVTLGLPSLMVFALAGWHILEESLMDGLLVAAAVYGFSLYLTIETLASVFDVAVYYYARTGSVPQGFDPALLRSAFVKE